MKTRKTSAKRKAVIFFMALLMLLTLMPMGTAAVAAEADSADSQATASAGSQTIGLTGTDQTSEGEDPAEEKEAEPLPLKDSGDSTIKEYKSGSWLYTWDSSNKSLVISEPAAMPAGAEALPAGFIKDKAPVSVSFTGGVKIRNGFKALNYISDATTTLDMSGADTSAMTSMNSIFASCKSLKTINISGLNTDKVTNMRCMFYKCTALENVDISGINTEKVTDIAGMFQDCEALTTLDVSKLKTGAVKKAEYMFRGCGKLSALDVSGFDTSKMENMRCMFYGCKSLKALDVSRFNTESATDMGGLFQDCMGLETLDVSGFDTGKVKKMDYMFRECKGLKQLNVGGFDTSQVTTMEGMFCRCSGLESLDVSNFVTNKVENMKFMFRLTQMDRIDLSKFNTASVKNMAYMFSGSAFTELDLSSFNTENVAENTEPAGESGMTDMLMGCNSLIKLVTPSKMGAVSSGLPHEMYDDDENDELALNNRYTDIPEKKTIWVKHPVVYMAADRTMVIAEQYVKYGRSAAPDLVIPPELEGKKFIRWIKGDGTTAAFENITAAKTVYADYSSGSAGDSDSDSAGSARTGDNSGLLALVALFFVSGGIMIFAVHQRRKSL